MINFNADRTIGDPHVVDVNVGHVGHHDRVASGGERAARVGRGARPCHGKLTARQVAEQDAAGGARGDIHMLKIRACSGNCRISDRQADACRGVDRIRAARGQRHAFVDDAG